jgi:hypothetical protein
MIVSLFDKENKMRQYIYLSGLGSTAYYLGLYIADISLFILSESVFAVFVWLFRLDIYSSQMAQFLTLMTTFGMTLIPFTYLFQHWFDNSNKAFRWIGWIYILIGIFMSTMLIIVFGAISRSSWGVYLGNGLTFFINPFYTFFCGTRDLILIYFIKKYFPNQPVVHWPITPNISADTKTCAIVMAGQTVFYLIMAIWKDYSDCNKFKKLGGQDGVL